MAEPTKAARADEIASRAIQLATAYLQSNGRQIADMAKGSPELLHDAARIVQQQPPSEVRAALSPEHLAFTLITAAYELLRTETQR